VRDGTQWRLVMASTKKTEPVEKIYDLEPTLTRLKLTAIREP